MIERDQEHDNITLKVRGREDQSLLNVYVKFKPNVRVSIWSDPLYLLERLPDAGSVPVGTSKKHLFSIRTLRFAAEVEVPRNGQEAKAGELALRWKHEINIAILRRRAAIARAVLPRATLQELWLLAGRAYMAEGNGCRD